MPRNFAGAGTGEGHMFTDAQVKEIMAAAGGQEMKDRLKEVTGQALEKGAFGAPWLWVVTDRDGRKGEPFFGSDRYVFSFHCFGDACGV